MGFHWHAWNFVLACLPAAGIVWAFGGLERETSIPWVNNNRGLSERIEQLEKASFGKALSDAPEAREERDAFFARQDATLSAAAATRGTTGDADVPAVPVPPRGDRWQDLLRRLERLEQQVASVVAPSAEGATSGVQPVVPPATVIEAVAPPTARPAGVEVAHQGGGVEGSSAQPQVDEGQHAA